MKKIPGNPDLLIDLNKRFYDCDGKQVELERYDKLCVKIELFGKTRVLNVGLISMLAWYELGDIPNLEKYIDKISVHSTNQNLRVRCGKVITFKEPIYFKPGFRYVPNYSRYAVSIDGVVIDTYTNLREEQKLDNSDYSTVYIYSPDKRMNRTIKVHRLVVFAWLKNDDFIAKPIVNHIDGNKQNNTLVNLEWCSYKENSNHAFSTGLNQCNTQMKTRDRFTGEVVIYRSATEMADKFGTSRVSATAYSKKLPGYLYQNRYEVKELGDTTPWYYERANVDLKATGKAIFTITVLNKLNGEELVFTNTSSFRKHYKLSSFTCTLDACVSIFKERYPDHDVSYKRNALMGPYRVINTEKNTVDLVNSLSAISELTGIGRSELQFDLSRGLRFTYLKKWIVAPGDYKVVLSEHPIKTAPYSKVVITDMRTGEETIEGSIVKASIFTCVSERKIAKCMEKGISYKNFKFRPLEQ